MRACVFTVGEEVRAVPVERVVELCSSKTLTEVPRAPRWILGVVHHRGRLTPVVNLFSSARFTPEDLLILSSNTSPVAIPVDGVLGILDVRPLGPDDMGVSRVRAASLDRDAVLLDVDGMVDLWADEVALAMEPTGSIKTAVGRDSRR